MKSKFDAIVLEYRQLLEAEPAQPIDSEAQPQPEPDQQPQNQPQPTQDVPQPEKSSVGFAVLTKIILDAFKVKVPIYKDDIKFSDNSVNNSADAFKYLQIVLRNLPPQTQHKLQDAVGRGSFGDVDELNIVYAADLALKALFYNNKNEGNSEYADIMSIDKVTTDNAKAIFDKIRQFFSGVTHNT